MTIDNFIMMYDEISTATMLRFDILMLFSIMLFISHVTINTTCKLFNMYSWGTTLISTVFSTIASFFILNSPLAYYIKNITLKSNKFETINIIIKFISLIWFIIIFLLIYYFYKRYKFYKVVINSPYTGYDEAFEVAVKLSNIKNIECRTVPNVNTIGIYGIIKPIIVVPEDFEYNYDCYDRQLFYLHELIHIKRKDFISYLIIQTLEIVFFIHVPIKWQLKKLELCIEQICDSCVMRLTSDKIGYSQLLVNEIKTNNIIIVPFSSSNYNLVKQRIEALFFKKNVCLSNICLVIALFITISCLEIYNYKNPTISQCYNTALIFENLDNTLDITPINDINEIDIAISQRKKKYLNVAYYKLYWEGMYAIYSRCEMLPYLSTNEYSQKN